MIKVNDGKDPLPLDGTLLIEVDYYNLPIPNNRLPKGVYYSFKNKWQSLTTLLLPSIKQAVKDTITSVSWGNISGNIANQADLQSELNKIANKQIGKYATIGTLTGTTDETILAFIEIPENTFASGDNVVLQSLCTKSGTSGYVTMKYRVSTSSSPSPITDGIDIATLVTNHANVLWIPFDRYRIHVDSPTSTISTSASTAIHTDITNVGSATITDSNIDWTQKQFVILTAELQSSADTLTFHSFSVYKQ